MFGKKKEKVRIDVSEHLSKRVFGAFEQAGFQMSGIEERKVGKILKFDFVNSPYLERSKAPLTVEVRVGPEGGLVTDEAIINGLDNYRTEIARWLNRHENPESKRNVEYAVKAVELMKANLSRINEIEKKECEDMKSITLTLTENEAGTLREMGFTDSKQVAEMLHRIVSETVTRYANGKTGEQKGTGEEPKRLKSIDRGK